MLLRCHAAEWYQGGSAGAVQMLAAVKPSQLLVHEYEATQDMTSQFFDLVAIVTQACFDRMQD